MTKLQHCSNVPTIWPKKSFHGHLVTGSAPTGSATRTKRKPPNLPAKLSLEVQTKEPIKVPPGRLPGLSKKSKKNLSLDINVNKSASPVNTGISKDILDLYKLRDNAGKVLPQKAVCKCGKVPYKKFVTIDRNEKNIKRFGNVSHCGSIWICPTCAYKKTKIRQEQLREIIKLHNNSGCSFYFVTLTIRHNSNQPLTVLLNKIQYAWKQITKERALKPLFKEANFIQSLEIRYSLKTGWSPHYHAVFMSPEKEKIKPLFDLLIDSWTKKTDSQKEGQKIIEANDKESLSEYIAKISLANELTEGQTKTSRKGNSVSYFDMLKDTVSFKKQIEEYSAATKNARSLRKSNGLNIIGDKENKEDTVIDNLLNIHAAVYKSTIVKNCDYKKVLENADSWQWLKNYFKGYEIYETIKMIFPTGQKRE